MFVKKTKYNKLRKQYSEMVDAYDECIIEKVKLLDEKKILEKKLEQVVTKDDVVQLICNRIDWYEGRIKECQGLYTDVYVENLLIGKYECDKLLEFILMHLFDDKPVLME